MVNYLWIHRRSYRRKKIPHRQATRTIALELIHSPNTEIAAARKSTKYAELEDRYIFQPIAVESLGPINDSAVSFLGVLGRRIAERFQERFEKSVFFIPAAVLIYPAVWRQ